MSNMFDYCVRHWLVLTLDLMWLDWTILKSSLFQASQNNRVKINSSKACRTLSLFIKPILWYLLPWPFQCSKSLTGCLDTQIISYSKQTSFPKQVGHSGHTSSFVRKHFSICPSYVEMDHKSGSYGKNLLTSKQLCSYQEDQQLYKRFERRCKILQF